ncbi:MAG: hypothetical protein FJ191_00175 [Gammaproteobacteria bacterium]|nr:hypothetical protein [Gammaproteobacteria bacterium]
MRVDRRTFLGLASGASLGTALAACTPTAGPRVSSGANQQGLRILPSTCDHDCGGRCLMQVHVRDGALRHITTDDGTLSGHGYGYHGPDWWQLRTCARGRAYRTRVYSPDRILAPMRRVGRRGEGRFTAISWDEALATVATRMREIASRHGPAAVFSGIGGGTASTLNASFDLQMLLARHGGFTSGWSSPSWEGAHFAMEYTLGLADEEGTSEYADGADGADFLNSRLIIAWGWNPAHTHFGTTTKVFLQQARDAGIPIVCVDPIYTDTAATWGREWIPIRPGTDAAVLMAMAYVILEEGLEDRSFVERFTVGAEAYRRHLQEADGGLCKDPRWAAALSDVPADTIARLARRYATAGPANLVAGYAPGRTSHGEQYHRAALALQALTGNVGRPGGGAAGHRVGLPLRYSTVVHSWWERFRRDLEVHDADIATLKTTHFAEAILGGRSVDHLRVGSFRPLPSDIRMLYSVAWNPVNQLPNINRTIAALDALDFIVVQDQRMTATARYADILLPACTMLEREDVTIPWRECEPHLLPQAQAIEPLGGIAARPLDLQRACPPARARAAAARQVAARMAGRAAGARCACALRRCPTARRAARAARATVAGFPAQRRAAGTAAVQHTERADRDREHDTRDDGLRTDELWAAGARPADLPRGRGRTGSRARCLSAAASHHEGPAPLPQFLQRESAARGTVRAGCLDTPRRRPLARCARR